MTKSRQRLITGILVVLPVFAMFGDRSQSPTNSQNTLMHILYEACRVRQQQTGQFPAGYRDLTGVLGENLRRAMPANVKFADPESEYSRASRQSPYGDRTPCLRLELSKARWLNVSVSGWIFESGLDWQSEFVDLFPYPFARPDLLIQDWRPMPDRAAVRSSKCGRCQVDLVPYCDAIPTQPWFFGPSKHKTGHKTPDEDPVEPGFRDWISSGTYEHDNILFDVRGAIQLDGQLSAKGHGLRQYRAYPREAKGIVVHQLASQIHVLAGTIGNARQGAVIGLLCARFDSGQIVEFPLRYGEEVASAEDSSWVSERIYPPKSALKTAAAGNDIQYSLHHIRITNPRPEDPIQTFDFVSGVESSHPYILAITLEP